MRILNWEASGFYRISQGINNRNRARVKEKIRIESLIAKKKKKKCILF